MPHKATDVKVRKFTLERGAGDSITLQAAMVNTDTGMSHGWVDQTGLKLSKETLALKEQLVKSLEADLRAQHFTDEHTDQNTQGEGLPLPGLGELLVSGNVPSI